MKAWEAEPPPSQGRIGELLSAADLDLDPGELGHWLRTGEATPGEVVRLARALLDACQRLEAWRDNAEDW